MKRLRPLVPVSSVLFASVLSAQTATTSLRGVVQDTTGAVIPGAAITLVNPAAGQTLHVTANAQGEYQLPQISPSRYTITAEAAGFGSQRKEAELLVNQPATVNFSLGAASGGTVVEVTESAQTLNNTDATIGNAFDNATIQSLPSETRNVPDLLSLQPGVFYVPPPADTGTTDSRVGAVNGERSDQSNVTLDGVDDNDQLRGLAFFGVLRETQDSIQEFRVVTSNANADEGRSAGAQVTMVTKSGTDHFHGAAYEYYRPTNTVSNDYFNKQGQLSSGQANRPPKLVRNIFGGDFGGFIIKDKLFFFGNYEGQRLAEDQVVVQTTPTAAYQAGTLQYQYLTNPGDPSSVATASLSSAQIAQLDAGCTVCGTPAYAPGPGPNPNALAYFNSEPAANGINTGDQLNTGSYTFASPAPQTLNTSIVRLDWTPSTKHHIFGRGGLQKDTLAGTEQFPGQPASSVLVDNSKGLIFGDTWTVTPSIVNDIRYGYIRQGYSRSGVGTGDYVDFRFLSSPTAETRATIINVPTNNIIDNLTIAKGKHTIGLGGNWRLIHINRGSDNSSYNSASTNPSWLSTNFPDPTDLGLPAVSAGYTVSYQRALANLLGTVPQVSNIANYAVTSAEDGTLLPDGAFISRHYKANEFEYYVQDQWQIRQNLTMTFGIRHTILQTPYETSGQQVTPTIDTHAWFTQREAAALQGQVYEQDLSFAPSGPYYGTPGFYPKQKLNIAPRFALAYAPDTKTSLRVGAGMYFDHYGEALINAFDQNGGSFGLSTTVVSQPNVLSTNTSPRFTGRSALPPSTATPAPSQTFPFLAPQNQFGILWGLDNRLKTPYTEAFDASVQRQLPGGMTLEVAYVGRLGRHLVQQLDLAEPVDYTDPQGGGDYYSAGARLSALTDQNAGGSAIIPAIPYFEHVFPFMQGIDYSGESATQAIYNNEWAPNRYSYGETTALADIDFYCNYGCPTGYKSKFWQNQFSSLYALSTIGMSYYNAAQVSLRHPMSHGVQFDVNYTFSKSIDMGSDAERTSEFSSPSGTGIAAATSEILNTWKPDLNRAVSDFDTRHIITVDTVAALPFGRGKALLGKSNRLVNAVVGGWQLSGIFRTTSGLPFSVIAPGWATNWQVQSFGVVTGDVKAGLHRDAAGTPNYFSNPNAINNGVYTGSPIRLPYPGEAGERNFFRGQGYLSLDNSLSKSWKLGDYGAVKFDWAVYNVTNTNRFDPSPSLSLDNELTSGSLGTASALLGGNSAPRRMQFALRYDF